MFGIDWQTSPREYEPIVERDVKIRMPDGVQLSADIWRPDAEGAFPALMGYHCYDQQGQTAPIKPRGMIPSGASESYTQTREKGNASLESGDPSFYVRRGYVHVLINVRGTGKSEGQYQLMGALEVEDGHNCVEWIAGQKWCDGNVGLLGVSYFAAIAMRVAATQPPHLRCIFTVCSFTDPYRDMYYHGGILCHKFPASWLKVLPNVRQDNKMKAKLGEAAYRDAVREALADPHLNRDPVLVQCLSDPENIKNSAVVDMLLNPDYNEYWKERTLDYSKIKVPSYIGCCLQHYGLHLPATFRSWKQIKAPKKMTVGPAAFMHRPLHQMSYESLRWFDHWMKGKDTKLMEQPAIKLFVSEANTWKESNEWPLPQTRFTPFYLHENGVLSEIEHFPYEGQTSFDDSPYGREHVEFWTPKFVEETEVIGPLTLRLFAASTSNEQLFFVTYLQRDAAGTEKILSRGWLRGSHRSVDPDRSTRFVAYHPHEKREPLEPGRVYEFVIPIVPHQNLYKVGTQLGIKIAGTDHDTVTPSEPTGCRGHIGGQTSARVTVFHNAEYPSCLIVPITSGNVLETFFSNR